MQAQVLEVVPAHRALLVGFDAQRPGPAGSGRRHTVYQVLRLRESRIVDIRGYPTRAEAAAIAPGLSG